MGGGRVRSLEIRASLIFLEVRREAQEHAPFPPGLTGPLNLGKLEFPPVRAIDGDQERERGTK